MMQTWAILLDSLRELRSRSLFWIALGISVLVSVMLFGLIGFDEKGWKILWFATNENALLREGSAGQQDLLKWLFGGALLWWWLTLGAIVLALITTANTIPEFVSSGSIDLTLSKPMGRVRLYVIKVASALLFMILQVTICVAIAYVLSGVRFGYWFHEAWLALPLVTLQFLYLFAVMSFVGLITRSSLASLLAVFIFWGTVSVTQFAANQLEKIAVESRLTVQNLEKRIGQIRERAATEGRELFPAEQMRIANLDEQIKFAHNAVETILPWKRPIERLELMVPKTADIQKIIAEEMDAPTIADLMLRLKGFDADQMAAMAGMADGQQFRDAQEAGAAGQRAARKVNGPVSIGSSMIVTSFLLGLSLWIFTRRDF